MTLLQQMIDCDMLLKFITEFYEIINKEHAEKATWEFYLHREYGKSYNEFLKDNDINFDAEEVTSEVDNSETTLIEAINTSKEILDNFRPV